MYCHLTAFLIGVVLDLIVGDPMNFPHPIRWIGTLIHKLDVYLLGKELPTERNNRRERGKGVILCLVTISVTASCTGVLMYLAYRIHNLVGIAVEAILTCYILAAKCLSVESRKVEKALTEGTIEDARYAVSMIVGRDTDCLDEAGVAKAAVETVAENTSDGVIAPLIYTCIGGPVLGLVYKAINTMDSMVGYHNDRYEYFGTAAARLDDIVNYLPARISALCMIVAAAVGGRDYSGREAARIFKRDRYNHKSPNSAQTESVCAGALGVQLAGSARYFGKMVEKPYIGDPKRNIEAADITRTCKLMYLTEMLCLILCVAIYMAVKILFG